MKQKWLAYILAVCMIISIIPATVLAADDTSTPAARIGETPYQTVEAAINAAEDNQTVTVLEGSHTSQGQEIKVDKAITIEGEGDRASVLENYVFSIESTDKAYSGHGTEGVDHPMNVTFKNLSFTGTSQIKVGFLDKQSSAYEALATTYLTVDDCYAYLTHSSSESNKGQLIYLSGTYNTNLDLTITDSTLINAHTIDGEDSSPIVNGNGTNLVRATITGNVFGSEEHPCSRFAIKFGRRQNNTEINISGNTVYGATTADKDFSILDLWQAGGNAYDGLQVNLVNNTMCCDISEDREVAAAYVESSVKASASSTTPSLIVADGNTVNDTPCDAVVNMADSADFPVAEAKLVTGTDGEPVYYATAQAALNTVGEAGGTVTLLQDVNGGLSVSGKTNLTVDGNGHTTGSFTFVDGNNGVSLQNVNFNLTGATTVGVNGQNNQNIAISNCDFTLDEAKDPWAAIYVQQTVTGLTIEENTFTINRTAPNNFQCIGFAYTENMRATNVIIRDNTMTATHETGYSYFVIGSQDAVSEDGEKEYGITNMEISGNTIAYPNDTTEDQYATSLANIDGLLVAGNTFEDCSVGVYLSSTSGLPTKDVTITGNGGDAKYMAFLYGDQALTGKFETDVPEDQIRINGTSELKLLKITFDANGGSCSVGTKVLVLASGAQDVALGELPTPTRSGSYRFNGWFTADGTPVTAETTFSADATVYAHWSYTGSSGSSTPTYSSTVESSAKGTVSLSSKNASKGATVTVTVTPDEGYVLDTITVIDKDGKAVEVTKTSDGKYTFQMPASAVTVKATFKEETPASVVLPFTDVAESAWYYNAVSYAYKNGMMTGTNDGTTFSPAMNLTRGMMAQILYNVEGKPDLSGENLGYPFADVPGDTWYADGVYWARQNGLADGYGNNTFGPEDSITREQMAVLLYNYASFKGDDVTASADLSTFTDGAQVSSWAQYAMQWAVAEELMQGSNNALNPQGTASRAEVAQILMNYFGQTATK